MSLDYIRQSYGVPAKRGMRITIDGRPATITGSAGARLRVRRDGEKRTVIAHPTWRVDYSPKPTEAAS
jgi:hypothetical protein